MTPVPSPTRVRGEGLIQGLTVAVSTVQFYCDFDNLYVGQVGEFN